MKNYTFLFFILLLGSCDVSSLSEREVTDISKLKFNIAIHDGTKDHSLNQIKVLLSDGKKQIINKHIQVLLNGSPMELYVKQELYYTTTSFYRTDSLSRKTDYYFEVILPDSSRYPVAYIRPKNDPQNNQFEIPKTFDPHKYLTIKWNHLDSPHRLDILKGVTKKEKPAENITEHGFSGRIIDTLTNENGEYIIPQTYFEDAIEIANYIEIEIERFESGLVNPKLHSQSEIIYDYTLSRVVNRRE